MPIFYECDRCTACCRWPGQVRLSDLEISRIADYLELSDHDFIQRYTRVNAQRTGLALQDKPTGECVFLEHNECVIQPVKPQQCRDFPNVWNFPGFQEVCRAKPREVDVEEYQALVAQATRS